MDVRFYPTLEQLVETPLGCVRTGHLIERSLDDGGRSDWYLHTRVVAEMIYGWSVIEENFLRPTTEVQYFTMHKWLFGWWARECKQLYGKDKWSNL